MAFDPISAAFDLGITAIKRIWPDPIDQAKEIRRFEELKQSGDLKRLELEVSLLLAQINVNAEQAKHKSIFVAGARPAAIWAGVFAMVWSGIIHPILTWVWAFAEMTGEAPPLMDTGALVTMLGGLLGVSGMRSFDKHKGTANNSLK